jgi:hypothetical protein
MLLILVFKKVVDGQFLVAVTQKKRLQNVEHSAQCVAQSAQRS